MRPSVPHDFESVISKPRLDSYKGYFRTTSTEESIGLYMWNTEMSAVFGTLLALFEVLLRNNIHRAMSLHYSRGTSTSIHWYDRIGGSLKPGTQAKIDDVRHEWRGRIRVPRNPPPSPDEIVSRVTFGFWPSILTVVDPRRGNADRIFPMIFPHHPLNANPLDWTVTSHRTRALAFVHELNTFRNRVAHHEPLWKFAAVIDTSGGRSRVIEPDSRNLTDSLHRFKRLLKLFDDGMLAMNPRLQADTLGSSWRRKLDYLLSPRGVARYRSLRHCASGNLLTPAEFRRAFPLIVKHNQPVHVGRASTRGIFIPD